MMERRERCCPQKGDGTGDSLRDQNGLAFGTASLIGGPQMRPLILSRWEWARHGKRVQQHHLISVREPS